MSEPTRWVTDTEPGHSREYVERFRRLAAEGEDLDGEARFVDAMLARGSRVLDAGCGPGRVGAALAARGHTVVGVDADPVLVAAARQDHPGPTWLVADLAHLDLAHLDLGHLHHGGSGAGAAAGPAEPFDLAVLAGNVMVFLAPGTETAVLRRVAAHVRLGGAVVTGFATDRALSLPGFDAAVRVAGLRVEHRFAGWHLEAWHDGAPWAVTVLRHA